MANPFAEYWKKVTDRMKQETNKFRFGSEMEAQSGGSSATFRASDSPEYVQQILSESPVSFINRYPEAVDELRNIHGLNPLDEDIANQAQTVNDATTSGGQSVSNGTSGNFFGFPSLNDFAQYFADKSINIGVILLALALILGGLFVLAMSTDTGKKLAKDGLEAAAA